MSERTVPPEFFVWISVGRFAVSNVVRV